MFFNGPLSSIFGIGTHLEWENVMGDRVGVGIPWPLLEEIQRRYSTDTEKNCAFADYYVNYHPEPEWEDLAWSLCIQEEFAAARESKSFMLTGRYCRYISRLLIAATMLIKRGSKECRGTFICVGSKEYAPTILAD